MPTLSQYAYDRESAVAYAAYWAYRRNPRYAFFDAMGGDCTNFVSQCLYAGSGVMNDTPGTGWYFRSLNDRAPAWSGVTFLYDFLTRNTGAGPFGREVPLTEARAGDVVQLALDKPDYSHAVLITSLPEGGTADPEEVLVASHTNDAACRQLATYAYQRLRVIHIDGVRVTDVTI